MIDLNPHRHPSLTLITHRSKESKKKREENSLAQNNPSELLGLILNLGFKYHGPNEPSIFKHL